MKEGNGLRAADVELAFAAARPIHILLLGPARAGKTFLLASWRGFAAEKVAEQPVRLLPALHRFGRDLDESIRQAVNAAKAKLGAGGEPNERLTVEQFAEAIAGGGNRRTSPEDPDALPLFEIGPIRVETRDWAGEAEIRTLLEKDEENYTETERALHESLEKADAVIIVVDPFSRATGAIAFEHASFLQNCLALCDKERREGRQRPVAVVATKFDHPRARAFVELLTVTDTNPAQHAMKLTDGLRDEAKDVLRSWATAAFGRPGTNVAIDAAIHEQSLPIFPCSAFGLKPNEHQTLRPVLTLEPLRFVIESVLQQREEAARALKKRADLDAARRAARLTAEREQRAGRRRSWARFVLAAAGLLVALTVLGAMLPLWRISDRLVAGQLRAAEVWNVAPLEIASYELSPLRRQRAGQLLVLVWGALRDPDAADEDATRAAEGAFAELVAHHASSPLTRQAALALVLGPSERAERRPEPDRLQLEQTLAERAASPRFAPFLDSWARQRVRVERARLLSAAVSGSRGATEAAVRLDALLALDAEPLPPAVAKAAFAALAVGAVGEAARWREARKLIVELEARARRLICFVPSELVGRLSATAVAQISALDGAGLAAACDALCDVPGVFAKQLSIAVGGRICDELVPKLLESYRVRPDAAVAERLAGLVGHRWLRPVLAVRDREVFDLAVADVFRSAKDRTLLELFARGALARAAVSTDAKTVASLDDADAAILFGARDAAARERHAERYQDLLRAATPAERRRGWERYLFFAELVQARHPDPALDAKLRERARSEQQAALVEIVERALSPVSPSAELDVDSYEEALAAAPEERRRELIAATVRKAHVLPARLFEQAGKRLDLANAKTPGERALRVVIMLRTASPVPSKPPALIAAIDDLVWVLSRSEGTLHLPAALGPMAVARLRTFTGVLVRSRNTLTPAGGVACLRRCIGFRPDDPGFCFAPADQPAVASLVWEQAVAQLATGSDTAGLDGALATACRLDPNAGAARVAALRAVLGRFGRDPGLRERMLAIAPDLARRDAELAAAVRSAAAVGLESEAETMLRRGDCRAAAERLQRAVGCDDGEIASQRRVTAMQALAAAAADDAALADALCGLLREGIHGPLDIAIRDRLGPVLESDGVAGLANADVERAYGRFRDAVLVAPNQRERRQKALHAFIERDGRGLDFLRLLAAFAARLAVIELSTTESVRGWMADLALDEIRSALTSGRVDDARELLGLLPVGRQREAVERHVERLSGCALVPGRVPFYAAIDLVRRDDYEAWVATLHPALRDDFAGLPGRETARGMRKVAAVAYARAAGGMLPTAAQLAAMAAASGPWSDVRGAWNQWVADPGNCFAPRAGVAPGLRRLEPNELAPGLVAFRIVYPAVPQELQ
ncbi:MAG: GTPase domain-containing protein [Planctomycetes bacterium]|nr:GTPase domain-containing protein [Planctomycetota bacterium]